MVHGRAGATLVVGIVLAVPSAGEFFTGNQSADQAAIHVLAALAAAWVGVGAVARVVRGYINPDTTESPPTDRRAGDAGHDGDTAGPSDPPTGVG
jgi:hypothetical protein